MKNKKLIAIWISLLVIVLLPNILSYFILKNPYWYELFALSLLLVLIPLVFVKTKAGLKLLFVFVLFSSFEIVTLITTKSRINNIIIASIFNTNKKEASEIFLGNLPIILFSISLVLIYIVLYRKVEGNEYVPLKYRLSILITSLTIILFQLFNTKSNQSGFLGKTKQSISDLKITFSYKVYPTDLVFNSLLYGKEVMDENVAIKNLDNFKFHAIREDNSPNIVVFIIGESSRVFNWSLFGYDRETNPLLKKQTGLYSFDQTFAASNSTYRSIPMLLSKTTPNKFDEWKHSGNLMQLFKEAGFSTSWIGGQSKSHVIVKLATRHADYLDFTTDKDEKLFNQAKKIISSSSNDQFVIIHTEGSHYDYKKRYPAKFDVFKPSTFVNANATNKTELINAYDNTILYTDYLINDLILFLNKQNKKSMIYYTSDHGENLMDDDKNLLYHVQSFPTKYELHVPAFVWLSQDFEAKIPSKVHAMKNNKMKKNTTTTTFHTVADLAGIHYTDAEKDKSVASDQFIAFKKRFVITNLKEVIPVD